MSLVHDLLAGPVVAHDLTGDIDAIFAAAVDWKDAAFCFVRVVAALYDALPDIHNLLLVTRHAHSTTFQHWQDVHKRDGDDWVDDTLDGLLAVTNPTTWFARPFLLQLRTADHRLIEMLQSNPDGGRVLEFDDLNTSCPLPSARKRAKWLANPYIHQHLILPFLGRLLQSGRFLTNVAAFLAHKRPVVLVLDAAHLPTGAPHAEACKDTFILTLRSHAQGVDKGDVVRLWPPESAAALAPGLRFSPDPTVRLAFWMLALPLWHGRGVAYVGPSHLPAYLYLLGLEVVFHVCDSERLPNRVRRHLLQCPTHLKDVLGGVIKVLHANSELTSEIDLTATFLNLQVVYVD